MYCPMTQLFDAARFSFAVCYLPEHIHQLEWNRSDLAAVRGDPRAMPPTLHLAMEV